MRKWHTKVTIDGTAYEVKGGSVMVDGTIYQIKKGLTMIDGTVYEIPFGGKTLKIIFENVESGNIAGTEVAYVEVDGSKYFESNSLKLEEGTTVTVWLRIDAVAALYDSIITHNGNSIGLYVGLNQYSFSLVADAEIIISIFDIGLGYAAQIEIKE